MKIRNLKLKNYRNYNELNINLDDKLNIFIGDNAQGKSNILESIYVLAVTKSYLSVKDKNLIKDGNDCCLLESKIYANEGNVKLNILITEKEKHVKINGKDIRKLVDYFSHFRVILFSPDNIGMIKDSPNVRRKFLNVEIGQINNGYVRSLQNYNAILKQRNEFLKICKMSKKINYDYLEIINEKFSLFAVSVIRERYKFISLINEYLSDIYSEIMDVDNCQVKYVSTILWKDDEQEMIQDFNKYLNENIDKDVLYGLTLIGPHRDDFKFFIGDKEMGLYASQGQLRAAVLALKLSEIEIFRKNTGDEPILLLDDIFSELDLKKKNRLIKYIIDDVQTIITTTDLHMIDEVLVNKAKIFEVESGKIVKEVERKVIQNGK